MTEREFIDRFEQQKYEFLVENVIGKSQIRILDQFEEWIKEKVPGETGTVQNKKMTKRTAAGRPGQRVEKKAKEKKQKQDFGEYLEKVVAEAEQILAGKGVLLNYVALDLAIGMKQSSRCFKICANQNVFCRIGKSWPRKGNYQGQGVVLIELVMDGYKTSVFLPLLNKKETIEIHVGMPVERELQHIENVGKYRFKLFFPFGDEGETCYDPGFIGEKLAEFIYISKICLQELGC